MNRMAKYISKVIKTIFFIGLLYPDDSWKIYDDTELAIINITIDPDDIDWMYNWENVESDSLRVLLAECIPEQGILRIPLKHE